MRLLRLRESVPKGSLVTVTLHPHREALFSQISMPRHGSTNSLKNNRRENIGWIAAKGVFSLLWSLHRSNRAAVYIINIGLCPSSFRAISDRIPAVRRESRERSGNKLNCTIPRSVRSGHGPSVMGWKPISDRNHPSSLSVKQGEASQPGVPVIYPFSANSGLRPSVSVRGDSTWITAQPREIPGIDYLAGISEIDRNGNFPKRRLSRCTKKN